MRIILGQKRSGKSKKIKEMLSSPGVNRVLILDYNDQYQPDGDEETIWLDEINPLLGPLGLDDAKALNAGYLEYSNLLYRKAKEILQEFASARDIETITNLRMMRLIEESVQRILYSWEPNEVYKGTALKPRIALHKNKAQMNMDETVAFIKKHPKVIFKTNGLHSEKVRAITYIVLARVSKELNEQITVISDNLTTVFNQGNVKLLLDLIDFNRLDFVISYNRLSNLAPALYPHIDTVEVFPYESNTDIKELENLMESLVFPNQGEEGKKKHMTKIRKKVKSLHVGESIEFKTKVGVLK